jgi:hypothetical protein
LRPSELNGAKLSASHWLGAVAGMTGFDTGQGMGRHAEQPYVRGTKGAPSKRFTMLINDSKFALVGRAAV